MFRERAQWADTLPRFALEPSANGLLWVRGTLFFCDHEIRQIGKILGASGNRLATEPLTVTSSSMVEGRELRLNGPNDLALAPDGLYIWFTDPSHGLCTGVDNSSASCIAEEKSGAREIHGVFRVSLAGEQEVAELKIQGVSKPNGVAFSADGKRIFVSNSDHIAVWDLHAVNGRTELLGGEAAGRRFMESGSPVDGSGLGVPSPQHTAGTLHTHYTYNYIGPGQSLDCVTFVAPN